MANKGIQKALGATDSGLRLSDYPLGSRQSRAAARGVVGCPESTGGRDSVSRPLNREALWTRILNAPAVFRGTGTFALCRCFL
jgi:hypothetical protein